MFQLKTIMVGLGAALWSLASAIALNVNHKGGAEVTVAGQARLHGFVEGGGSADVDVYWGPSDGGTNPGDWAHKEHLAAVKAGEGFAINAEKLIYGQTYFYRCHVSKGDAGAWASASVSFTTLRPTVAVPAGKGGPVLTVLAGLACWFDASTGVKADEAGVVQSWSDLSGNGHHATLAAGAPVVVANQIGGRPAMQFRTGKGACGFTLDGPFFVGEQYVVVRSPHVAWNKDGCFLGRRWGRSSSYRLGNNSTKFWGDQYPEAVSKNGKKLKDHPFDLTSITEFMILKIDVNEGDMSDNAYQIGMADLASCDFDVAEILGFQTRLSPSDEELVTGYLAGKYGMKTAFPDCAGRASAATLENLPAVVESTSATISAMFQCPGATYNGRVFWGTSNGGTDPALWANSASVGTFTDAGKKGAFTLRDLTPGETYYFTFGATNPLDSIWAPKVASFRVPWSAAALARPPALAVKEGLVCWYDASSGLTANAKGEVEAWDDLSGKGHETKRGGGAPIRVINGVNGKPAVQFRKSWLALSGKFFAKEHYLVLRSPTARWSGAGGILGRLKGRASSYNTWGRETGFWTDRSPDAVSRNGVPLTGPGFDCSPLAEWMVLKIVVNNHDESEASYGIGNNDGMVANDFDVAEILGYDTILSPGKEALVGGYLAAKYGIKTAYPPLPSPVSEVARTVAPYADWRHVGALWLLTNADGANLPPTAVEENFPVLVRLDKDWFPFAEAEPHGEDLRFSSSAGAPLAYQIDEWNAEVGTAAIWVQVPLIKGNARQEIKMHWGKAKATSESSGPAVFNAKNGYLSVWHMNNPLGDDAGRLVSQDIDTVSTLGVVGLGRKFVGGKGINGGQKIRSYPFASSPHTSEVWFKADKLSVSLMNWGKSDAVNMRLLSSPSHVAVATHGGVQHGKTVIPKFEWTYAVYAYDGQHAQIYVNGQPDTEAPAASVMRILTPVELQIGGGFVGEMDEVRISKVARSADWVKLAFENQKPHQTLVGPLVSSGSGFTVSEKSITLGEGGKIKVTATAGGAQKVSWIIKTAQSESVVETDRFHFTLEAGRVKGDRSFLLQVKAVFADGVKTIDIPVTIREEIPDPVFTLKAPARWDGRETIEVVPEIANLAVMRGKGAGELKYDWTIPPMVEFWEVQPGKLILKRARNSGDLIVKVAVSNGGQSVTQDIKVVVKEPAKDAWVQRVPEKEEKPVEGQFYARDDANEGTLYYHGILEQPAESVFLKLYADEKLVRTESQKLTAENGYAFAVKLKAGLIQYRVEFGTVVGGKEIVGQTVKNLVCGDAYLIEGQSNALATDTGEKSPAETSEWIRSYGRAPSNPNEKPSNLWCSPVWKAAKGEKAELGWWGMELAKRLLASQKVPIFMINGAVGGTRIDQHQRNAESPTDLKTIYGRMLWRVEQARLTHGIRAVFWHQGEADQGLDGPDGGYGSEFYDEYFLRMSADWKRDFPNLRHYYLFQIWPNACSQGGGHGDRLREVQRTLPRFYSNMDIVPTLGIKPPGGCHYPLIGWTEFAKLLQPLIERDFYGQVPVKSITGPNLQRAAFANGSKDTIVLEFDQPVVWADALAGQFYLDGEKNLVASGSVQGNVLTLKLKAASVAKTVTYLKELQWSQDTLLVGANGIAALTFCEVPIEVRWR